MNEFWIATTLSTLKVVCGVLILTSLLAIPSSWLIERSNLPNRKLLRSLLPFSFLIPCYLFAVSWITLANPSVGWINEVWRMITHHDKPLLDIYGLPGIIFVESMCLFPILFLALSNRLTQISSSLEEAARLSGASMMTTFRRVTFPILKPTYFSSLLLVGLASAASYGVPAMLGAPSRIFVFTTGITSQLRSGTPEGLSSALYASSSFAVVSTLLTLIYFFATKKKFSLVSGKSDRHSVFDLGPKRYFISFSILTLWTICVALPALTLVVSSFSESPQEFWKLTTKSWTYVFQSLPGFQLAAINSLISSVAASLVISVLGFGIGLLAWRSHHDRRRSLGLISQGTELGALILYSMPGTVIGVFLTMLWHETTLAVLTTALVLKYFSLGLSSLIPALFAIHPSLIEAARIAGANSFKRFIRIWMPLLAASFASVFLMCLLLGLSELTMATLLTGPGSQNLGVLLFELHEYADRASASVIGSIILVISAALQFALQRSSSHEH